MMGSFWQHAATRIDGDTRLREMSDDQLRALVDILVVVVQADRKVTPLEVAGFNHIFFDIPWLEGRHELLREAISAAGVYADKADEEGLESLATDATEVLVVDELRDTVFLLAASLARVDLKLVPAECRALRWIAAGLGLDQERVRELIAQADPDR